MNYRHEENRDQTPREDDHDLRYEPHQDRYDQPARYDADPRYDHHPDSHYDDGHYSDRDHEAREYDHQDYDDHHYSDDAYNDHGDEFYAHEAHEDQPDHWTDQQWSDDYHSEAPPEIKLYPPVDDSYRRDYSQPFSHDGDNFQHRVDPQFAGSNSTAGSGIRLNDEDLRDVGNLPFARFTGRKVAKVAAVTLFFAFGAMVVMSVKPQMSAYDIVSMDSYKSQQQPEWTLDQEDIEGCDSLSACFKESLAQQKNSSETPAIAENAVEIPANSIQVETPVIAEPAEVVEYNNDTMRVAKQWSNIRNEPGMSGSIVTAIPSGLEVRVLGQVGTWYEIVTSDDRAIQGFMHQSTLR
jgi:hypothetical protein